MDANKNNLVIQFEQLITPSYRVDKNGNKWVFHENNQNSTNQQFSVHGAQSLAFSLDKSGNHFPFLASSLNGVRKVSDGIIVFCCNQQYFVVAIEMKSNKHQEAYKQIASSKHLIDWMVGLLKTHNHWTGEYTFCGLISKGTRKQPNKTTSRRGVELTFEKHPTNGISIAIVENIHNIGLVDIHKSYLAKFGN